MQGIKKKKLSFSGVGKLQLAGHIWPVTCSCKLSFIGAQPHSFIYMLSMAALILQWQSWVAVTEISGPQTQKYLLCRASFLFIYFWLCWVFVAAHGPSLVAASRGYSSCGVQASHCGGFSCFGVWALGVRASVVAAHGLSSCGLWALERRPNSCGTRV